MEIYLHIHIFSTKVLMNIKKGSIYLPPSPKYVDEYFLRQIMNGEKKVILANITILIYYLLDSITHTIVYQTRGCGSCYLPLL